MFDHWLVYPKNEENIEKCLIISTCLVMGDSTLIMFHEVVS